MEISYGVRFTLNVLTHITVLWLSLLILFIFVTSKTEVDTIKEPFEKATTLELQSALRKANDSSGGLLKKTLYPLKEPLLIINQLYDHPDQETKQFNKGVIIIGLLIFVIFCAVLTGILLTLKMGLDISVGKTYSYILAENGFLFVFLFTAEFLFSDIVGNRYIPVKPSQIVDDIILDLKQVFV
jgi:hypothetical protein